MRPSIAAGLGQIPLNTETVMNNRCLLTILLVGMSISACAPFEHYRTNLTEDFECAVDNDSVTETLKLCEDRDSSNPHAIQHRHYTGYFEDEGDTDKPDKGDYYLAFVEFDDQGWFAERKQMDALFALLNELKDKNNETLIYVYAHGWKHNASSCDNNVVCFSRLLERTDLAEQKLLGSNRTVVGVYLGWRGLPYKAGALTNLSFWSRKNAAARVGSGGVMELLVRLNDYRNSRQTSDTTNPPGTQLVIMGHSFGGLVIYSALSHALMERAAKTPYSTGAAELEVAKSFGDFVMLVNPAFEGSLYEPLFQIATNRCYVAEQRPVMMIVTSEADNATGTAFPIGRTLDTLFQHAMTKEQRQSMRKAIGHDDRYLTHELRSDGTKQEEVGDESDCPCPFLEATSNWSQIDLLDRIAPMLSGIPQKAQCDPIEKRSASMIREKQPYGSEIELTRARNSMYASNYPYLVVKTDAGVISDHNNIYSNRFINFLQLFLSHHITAKCPLLLPGHEDIQPGIKVRSCSEPTQDN
jgi:hypothetical protein